MASLSEPPAGALFEGRYRIGKLIGEGGFSRVYHALDPSGRPVALKLLVREPGGEDSTYARQLHERFMREARLLEQLRDPHTITMYDFGRSADGVPYMAFEYLEGQSLFAILRDTGALPCARAVNVLRQTLLGLKAAHRVGIVHRDIKPTNIMVLGSPDAPSPHERVKLLDFGIAKAYVDHTLIPGNQLTGAGTLVGTPRYMSPEQLRDTTSGSSLGPATDLYSLGLVSIEMLTGRKLIPVRDRVQLIDAHLSPTPFRIPANVAAPEELRAVIHRMVEKDPEARYRSAEEVLRDLDDWQAAEEPTVGIIAPTELLRAPPEQAEQHGAPPSAPEEDTVLQVIDEAQLQAAIATHAARSAEEPTQISAMEPTIRRVREDEDEDEGEGLDATIATPLVAPRPTAPASTTSTAVFTMPRLSGAEKAALIMSLLLPGSGHFLLGQPLKAAALLVGLFLTLGLGYLLALGVVFDALLVIRARRRRRVGAFEFLPDLDEVLRL